MKLGLLAICLSVGLSISTTARADVEYTTSCAKKFLAAGATVISLAQQNGWTQIYGRSLDSLTKILRESKTPVICFKNFQLTINNRQAATWVRINGKTAIRINPLVRDTYDRLDKNLYGALALHEILGANEESDKEYELSSVLLMMAEANASQFPETDLFKKETREVAGDGGSTGAGGGGDPIEIYLKSKMLRQMIEFLMGDGSFSSLDNRKISFFLKLRVKFQTGDHDAAELRYLLQSEGFAPLKADSTRVNGISIGVNSALQLSSFSFQRIFSLAEGRLSK